MTNIPKFSPGCFGSAVTFRKDDMVCGTCKFAGLCEPAHLQAVAALRERYGIEAPAARTQKKQVKEAPAKTVDPALLVLPKKTRVLIERLDRGDFDIVGKLKRGENPFSNSFQFLRVACHLLLRMKDPIDAKLLATAFVKALAWQQNTAEAHARMAIQALTHVGAVDNVDGRISLRRI